jgi:hypothetical protein
MITKNNTKEDNNNNDFQLHLYDGYNDIALIMNINIQDFVNMFDVLGPYFQRAEIEL